MPAELIRTGSNQLVLSPIRQGVESIRAGRINSGRRRIGSGGSNQFEASSNQFESGSVRGGVELIRALISSSGVKSIRVRISSRRRRISAGRIDSRRRRIDSRPDQFERRRIGSSPDQFEAASNRVGTARVLGSTHIKILQLCHHPPVPTRCIHDTRVYRGHPIEIRPGNGPRGRRSGVRWGVWGGEGG